jgi:hypothetical protein
MHLKDLVPGRRYRDKDGDEVAFIGFAPNGNAVCCVDGEADEIFVYTGDEHFTPIMAKKSGWINIYTDGLTTGVYGTEREAARLASLDDEYVATIQIEWEEPACK